MYKPHKHGINGMNGTNFLLAYPSRAYESCLPGKKVQKVPFLPWKAPRPPIPRPKTEAYRDASIDAQPSQVCTP
jgi:hypothetical protein